MKNEQGEKISPSLAAKSLEKGKNKGKNQGEKEELLLFFRLFSASLKAK